MRRFSPGTRTFIATAILTVITTILLSQPGARPSLEKYGEGDVVRADVLAPIDLTGIDEKEQERRRQAAANNVRPVFRFDTNGAERAAQTFGTSWNDLKNLLTGPEASADRSVIEAPPVWPEIGDREVGAAFTRLLAARNFAGSDLERLTTLLRLAGDGYIYADHEANHLAPEIQLSDLRSGTQTNLRISTAPFKSLSAARATLQKEISGLRDWDENEQRVLSAALPLLVQPNLTYDAVATEAARKMESNAVAPATISLKRNQIVAREGDRVNEQMLAQFTLITAQTTHQFNLPHMLGLLFIVSALFWTVWKFTEHRSASTSLTLPKRRAFLLVISAVVVETVLMRVGLVIAESVASQSTGAMYKDPTIISFAIPFAAAALLVALLVDTQLGLVTGLVTALFAGVLAPDGIALACFSMISSAASIYGIERYRERQSVTLAGVFVGLVNMFMAVAVILYLHQTVTFNGIFFSALAGIAGGLLTTIFTAGGLPINESMFGILTDVKLLELSNADLPVLGQLALRAPGTNQHSHAVGQLAEESCRAIGANALLARIGALYHDIGKLAAPDMFIENQNGDNPHDRLRPSNSARIITSHVTYGLRLAKELGLPKPIADFIPQHHGTRTLHYFLRKAQAQARPDEVIDETEFRYPGPKPQFKEAAIMMIADSCEAAARSLARPDPESIRAIASKIVDAILSDGQLDECDLTLRELKLIRESVIISLTAIYHARIDYPGFNPPRPLTTSNGSAAQPPPATPPNTPSSPLPAPELDTKERGMTYQKVSEIPIDSGGEVEDEAVRHQPVSK
ncbi:MAG TPA: HDIG domain-containing protein [Pyrinomonadaceae bacterium]|nr:HDIG domain-containing protein [Pyrinomonadaceae bacterium]